MIALSLMPDQSKRLKEMGLTCGMIGYSKDGDKEIMGGKCH
jgi:hypothetical protein